MRICFLGCGFIASHILPNIIPHTDSVVLVDRENVEIENYENYIIPKRKMKSRKVLALSAMIQYISDIESIPIFANVTRDKLASIHEIHRPDLYICTFDNVRSRIVVRDLFAEISQPCLFVGVTEKYIDVSWEDKIWLPSTDEEIQKIEEKMKSIRDVCSRLEFRGLGILASGLAYHAITRYITDGIREAVIASVDDRIGISVME